jgi:predicted Rossmann fold flavoprotein
MSASESSRDSPDIVVVGGGAAGVFAAITAAEQSPGGRVLVLEKGTSLLAKVRISGGGRCNVTHACFEPRDLVRHYPRGSRELLGPFHAWQPRDTVAWFESRGARLQTEPDGRMFPVTDSSQTIMDCLLDAARRGNVELRTGLGLADATRTEDGFNLRLTDDTTLTCKRLLIATGGLKPGPLLETLRKFGHTITPLAPSLFTFHIKDPRIDGLQGLAVASAEAFIPGTGFRQRGPVLVTHWGLSGPAILKLSAWGARWAQEQAWQFPCVINWLGADSAEAAHTGLDACRRTHAGRLVRAIHGFDLPLRLWERLVAAADIAPGTSWNQLRREQAVALATQLTRCELRVTGKSMFKEEFVTCGGVALNEVHFKTMESRLVPGLHFAGEVLDIDGVTGGFNFQSAWTTGRLAGLAMAAALQQR